MRRLFATVGACGVLVGLASAADPVPTTGTTPAPTLSAPPISRLVDQLGSDRFAEREAATAALENLGVAALPALGTAARSESAEVRERAAILYTKIQRSADSSARLVAKRVKLDYQNLPVGTAVNDLRTRTGLNVTLDPARVENPLRRISCQTAELPVWQALEAFCVAAGLREAFQTELDVPKPNPIRRGGFTPPPQVPNADAVAVTLIDGKPQKLAGDRSCAVRVLALPATFPGHKVTLGTGEVTLCFDVTPVPGLNWLDVTGVKIKRLIDSTGRSGGGGVERTPAPFNDPNGMVVFARPGMGMGMRFDMNGNPIPPDSLMNPRVLNVPLRLGNPSAKSIKHLEGSIFGEIRLTNQVLVTMADPKQHINESRSGAGDVRFSVSELKEPAKPGAVGTLRLMVEAPSPWVVNARRRGWNPMWPEAPQMTQGTRVEAFDAAGKPFPMTGSTYNDVSDDGMTMISNYTFTFRHGAGVPAKLVVIGSKLVTVEVPFVMDDVLLP